MKPHVMFLVAWACACTDGPPDVDAPIGRTTFAFEPIALDRVPTRWGAPVAPGVFFGGVDQAMSVQADVFTLTADDETLHAELAAVMEVPRFCACGIRDEGRDELIVLGGRDGQFRDEPTAVVINLDTQEATNVETNGAVDAPVGCQSWFSAANDKGYVFGGLSSGAGFSDGTFRWDPESRTFTELGAGAGAGPAARYDAGIIENLSDGSTLLVGGMGGGIGVEFYSDVWRFDPATETWSEIPTTTAPADVPQGRRYPWVALSPDENTLLYGFGSDSPRGESVLGDLWSFDIATGKWAELDVEGELPAARGFTYRLPGPANSAGVLVGGSDATLSVFTDAFVLRVPESFNGAWK